MGLNLFFRDVGGCLSPCVFSVNICTGPDKHIDNRGRAVLFSPHQGRKAIHIERIELDAGLSEEEFDQIQRFSRYVAERSDAMSKTAG